MILSRQREASKKVKGDAQPTTLDLSRPLKFCQATDEPSKSGRPRNEACVAPIDGFPAATPHSVQRDEMDEMKWMVDSELWWQENPGMGRLPWFSRQAYTALKADASEYEALS